MNMLNNLLISVTIVSIFSTIILTIVSNENCEIVKISCGLLMIIVILSSFRGGVAEEFLDFDSFYKEYEIISQNANENYQKIEEKLVKETLEQMIFEQIGIESEIFLNENYEITKILVLSDVEIEEISKILGISTDKIEYIESR